MKRCLLTALAVTLVLTLVPVAMIRPESARKKETPPDTGTARTAEEENGNEVIDVFVESDGRTEEMAMRDYIVSVLAAEMPAAYEEQALRAQAAACVTLARYMKKNGQSAGPDGAVISTDPGKYQGYLSVEDMKARWGDDFEDWYARLCDAVDEVLPYEITYDGAPILAAFHAISPGMTETAETVWGKKIDYLVSVESDGDRLSPGYSTTVTLSPADLTEKLALTPGDSAPAEWLGESSYTAAGTLTEIEIAGALFSGSRLRQALGLRSAAVTAGFDGENFVFSVKGYGHGVGLSQYGADYLARQGMTWREIVAHYYPGTSVVQVSC